MFSTDRMDGPDDRVFVLAESFAGGSGTVPVRNPKKPTSLVIATREIQTGWSGEHLKAVAGIQNCL